MKIGELRFRLPGMVDDLEAKDLDLTVDEFKDLTGLLRQLQQAQVDIEKLRTEQRPRVTKKE